MTCLACLIQLPKCLWCPYQLNFTITSNISSPASKWSNSKVKGPHVHSILPRLFDSEGHEIKKKHKELEILFSFCWSESIVDAAYCSFEPLDHTIIRKEKPKLCADFAFVDPGFVKLSPSSLKSSPYLEDHPMKPHWLVTGLASPIDKWDSLEDLRSPLLNLLSGMILRV